MCQAEITQLRSIVTDPNKPNPNTGKIWLFIHSFKGINHSLWSTAEPVCKEHKKGNMESSWSAGMNMTCCFLGKKMKKKRRNEEIKEWKQMSVTFNIQNISSQASAHSRWTTTWRAVLHLMSEKLLDSYVRTKHCFTLTIRHTTALTGHAPLSHVCCKKSATCSQERAVFIKSKIHTPDEQQTCISQMQCN